MALPVSKRDYELSSGAVVSIGVNFKALELMADFPGGLSKLQKEMQGVALADPDSEDYDGVIKKALYAMGYMLHALITAGGQKCSYDEAVMAISPNDFEQLNTIFEEFSEAMSAISKKKAATQAMRQM